jgi:hypothetical protein
MAQVVSFTDYTPAPRYDGEPWTEVDIEEAAESAGPWTVLETQALSPVDADPENPATRSFTTELAGDGELWYRLIFRDADGDEMQPTLPVQNVAGVTAYATVSELARVLQIPSPSEAQRNAMERVLAAAAGEINADIDLGEDDYLTGWELQLAAQVNLQRAAELWMLQEVPLGLAGIGSEFGMAHLARDSWAKYSYTLAPLKRQWGLA